MARKAEAVTEPRLVPEHRTSVGASWESIADLTRPGQAHWADPSLGKTCRECVWWDTRRELDTGHRVAFPRDGEGRLQPMKCGMAQRMMFKTWGVPKVPHDAFACRHFAQAEIVPPVSVDRTD